MSRWARGVFQAVLVAGLAAVLGCGSEETIRVDLLPPGDARGEAATGMYRWVETVTSSDCPGTVTVGSATVPLPHSPNEFRACADVFHDAGYYAVDFFGFSVAAGINRPEFAADGGLWQAGQFRIGGIFSLGTGVTARALLDGQYLPPTGSSVVRSFEGVGLVQVFATETGGGERYVCQYNLDFTGDREPGCGAE
jgi:hypothetical protein